MLADYLSSVFTREAQYNTHEEPIRCCNTVETCTINPPIVASKIKTFKSPGPDGVHHRVINELADCINIPLSTVFNTSLTTCRLPIEWKQSNISPIHKKGSKTLPQNYRPVSLTRVVGRIMEEIITYTITVYMTENELFSKNQFDVIKARSIVLHLLKVLDMWTEPLNNGGCIDVIYCDFIKVVDKVPHTKLMKKIQRVIKGNTIN